MKIYQTLLALLLLIHFVCSQSIVNIPILTTNRTPNLLTATLPKKSISPLVLYQTRNTVYFSKSVNDFMNG